MKPEQMNDDLLISKREILAVLFRHAWAIFFIVFGCVATAGYTVYFLISPSYSSEAILILNTSFLTEPLRDAPPEGGWEKLATFHTQRDILTSERMAIEAVNRTNLAETRIIGRIEQLGMRIGDLKRYIGERVGIERWTRPWSAEAAAIGAVHDFVETAVLPDSKAIQVTFRSKDPQEAAEVLTALIEAHSDYYYDVIQDRAKGVVTYLEQEYLDVEERLRNAETALFAFKQNDRLDRDASEQIGRRSQLRLPGFVGIADSADVQEELKLYILKLEEELRISQQIVDVRKRDRISADLRKRINLYLDVVNSVPERELRLVRLKREYDTAEDDYQLIQRNLAQARIVAGGQTDEIRLIDIFQSPQARDVVVFPKKKMVLILAAFLGTMLALTWAFTLDYLDHTVRSAKDVNRYLGVRLLASMERIS